MHASASIGYSTIGTRALVVLGIRWYSGLGVPRIAVKVFEEIPGRCFLQFGGVPI